MKTKLILLMLLVSSVAIAQSRKSPTYHKTATVTSQTLIPNNATRHGWCVEAAGSSGAASNPVWVGATTNAGLAMTLTTANGRYLAAGASYCESPATGPFTGPVQVVSKGSEPTTGWEW